jgi:radical SAM superfamily enzyme YgiQ (UPF0313 family)
MNNITLVNITIAKNFNDKVVYKHNSVGIFLLIANLEKFGYKTSFHEYSIEYQRKLSEEIENFIASIDTNSLIIGIGCHSVHLPFVVKTAQAIKERFPGKVIILGGPGPTGVAKELLEKFSFIDAVAIGEAEETIIEIVKNGPKGFKDIKGIAFRQAERVYLTPPRDHIDELDKLPLPAYQAVDFARQYQIATVITSRGCPYRCKFCSLTDFDGRKVRYNSIENVIQELKLLTEKYGFKDLFFVDPTFTINKKRTIALCQRIVQEKLDISWFCMTRTECIDEELLEELGKSGCKTIFYGLDTGSDRVLKKIKKGFGVKEALSAIEKSVRFIKVVEVGLMWGFPFETLADFKETLRIREYLEKDLGCNVQLRWLEPYPATEFFRKYKRDLFLPKNHSLMFQPEKLERLIAEGKSFYRACEDTCRIPADVTSIRFIIAASQTASTCRDIIEENPYLFSDYYRYKTPDLEEKLNLASRYSLY